MIKYWWIRVYDYNVLEDTADIESIYCDKGTLLDEWYIVKENASRDDAKQSVINKYGSSIKFAKPRKTSGQYAIVMESNSFFYDRFYKELPEGCICFNCHKPIEGKAANFPKLYLDRIRDICGQSAVDYLEDYTSDELYFCSYGCSSKLYSKLMNYDTLEFQSRSGYESTGVYGYIYHIYNRSNNKHYIGQTKYMPFFRWQEHVKDGVKGDICDLVFEVITAVPQQDQDYLNNIEAYWIKYYSDMYGEANVMNITHPQIHIQELIQLYDKA